MPMKTVTLITLQDQVKAHMMRDILKNEGIESVLQGELSAQVLSNAIAMGIQILVFEEDLERAKKIIEERFPDDI